MGDTFGSDLQDKYKKELETIGIYDETHIDPRDLLSFRLSEVQEFVKKVIVAHSKLLTLLKSRSGQRGFITTALKKAKATTTISELSLYYHHYKTAGVKDYECKFTTTMDGSLKGGSNAILDDVDVLSELSAAKTTASTAMDQFCQMNETFTDYTEHTKKFQSLCMESTKSDIKLTNMQLESTKNDMKRKDIQFKEEYESPEFWYKKYTEAMNTLDQVRNSTGIPEEQRKTMIEVFQERVDELYSKIAN